MIKPLDTVRKSNVHKTFRRRPTSYVSPIYVLYPEGKKVSSIVHLKNRGTVELHASTESSALKCSIIQVPKCLKCSCARMP